MNKINDEKKFVCLVKNFLLTCMSKNDYQHNVNKRFQNLPTPNPRQILRECRDKQHTFERLCLDAYKSCETKYTVLCECIISIKANEPCSWITTKQQQAHHSTSWHKEITVSEINGNNQGMNCLLPFIFCENKRNLFIGSFSSLRFENRRSLFVESSECINDSYFSVSKCLTLLLKNDIEINLYHQ